MYVCMYVYMYINAKISRGQIGQERLSVQGTANFWKLKIAILTIPFVSSGKKFTFA